MLEAERDTERGRKVEDLRRRLGAELDTANARLRSAHPVESYIALLDIGGSRRDYCHVPPEVTSLCASIARNHGQTALELYHRLLLVTLMGDFELRRRRYRIPESILALIPVEFDRILSGLEAREEGYYLHGNDLFAKDLGLCRLKLLPCGSEVIDQGSGIPRSTLWRGGLLQLVRGSLFFVGRLGGFWPLYESHWDRRLVRHFTAADYDRCYVRISEMLELNPGVRGMFGSSWWFDPRMQDIAPELVFLSRTPVEHGAQILRVGSDAGAVRDATLFSKKRKALYTAGKYRPTRYMLVWARNDMLDWASRYRAYPRRTNLPAGSS